jgi:prephenate dehydrogenase
MHPRGLITDVGSTKRTIAERIAAGRARSLFVGSHPLAGGTGSGCHFAKDDLLVGSLVVVTPYAETDPHLVARTEELWQALGARTSLMSPEAHDQALAQTSHLPHLLAAALAGATPRDLLPLTATGWQSTTRVASGNAELWRQILEENRLPALQALQNFAKVLAQWLAALENNDGHTLQKLLEEGKATRDALGN